MAQVPRIASASWTVNFPEKPIWRDKWLYQETWAGAAIGLLSGQQLVQRFQVTSKAARPITLFISWMSQAAILNLIAMANSEEAITVYIEENGTGIPVVFRPVNPIELSQVGNEMADEDKQLVGSPYDRYDVTLNLVSLAA